MTGETRKCLNCSKTFETNRLEGKTQRLFCSRYCNQNWAHKQRQRQLDAQLSPEELRARLERRKATPRMPRLAPEQLIGDWVYVPRGTRREDLARIREEAKLKRRELRSQLYRESKEKSKKPQSQRSTASLDDLGI